MVFIRSDWPTGWPTNREVRFLHSGRDAGFLATKGKADGGRYWIRTNDLLRVEHRRGLSRVSIE